MNIFSSWIDSLTLLEKDAVGLPFPKQVSQNGWAGWGWRKPQTSFCTIVQGWGGAMGSWKESSKRQWSVLAWWSWDLPEEIRGPGGPYVLENYLSHRDGSSCPGRASTHLPQTCHQPAGWLINPSHVQSPDIINGYNFQILPCIESL